MTSTIVEPQVAHAPAEPSSVGDTDVRPDPELSQQTRRLAGLLAVASLIMVLWNLQDASLMNANTGSRYATVESLVDHGTYHIDKSRYVRTIDKVKAGEHYISSKPPVLPTYAAGVYWVHQKLTGKTIAEHEGSVVWTVSLFTGWLGHLIFLVYFYRFCRLLIVRDFVLLVTFAAACFGYLGAAYATHINNHSIGAALCIAGLYHAYRARQESSRTRDWIVAGLVLGLVPSIDTPSAALTALTGVYLASKDWRRASLLFAPALVPGLALGLTLGYLSSGSLVPVQINSDLRNFAGNYFRGARSGIDALREPKHIYGFHMLLGHHGLFSMTPLLGFGLWELLRRLRRGARLRAEAWTILLSSLIVFTFYLVRTRNYGGWCVGMRWLVPLMPLLLLFFGLWLDRVRLHTLTWAAVVLAFGISAFHVQDGLTGPFQFSVWHNYLEDKPNRGRTGKKMNLPAKPQRPKTKPKSRPGQAQR